MPQRKSHNKFVKERSLHDVNIIKRRKLDGSMIGLSKGTADNAQVHVYDVTDYQWVCSWSFNDAGCEVADRQVTSVACSLTNDDVATAVASTVKIWNLRFAYYLTDTVKISGCTNLRFAFQLIVNHTLSVALTVSLMAMNFV
jgi:hypothetical protein